MTSTTDDKGRRFRILVTAGDEGNRQYPAFAGAAELEWRELAVLDFLPLPIKQTVLERLIAKPVDWLIFTSPRGVRFWSEAWSSSGEPFPTETRIACIGALTAEAAKAQGYSCAFFPTDAGTEGFLRGFEAAYCKHPPFPSLFIPAAQEGRTLIKDRLQSLGCEVISVALYQTRAKEGLCQELSQGEVESMDLILFTSPSSVRAFLNSYCIPEGRRVGCLGIYTSRSLQELGIEHRVLPSGDLARVGEILNG